MEDKLLGNGVSPGIVIGKVLVMVKKDIEINNHNIQDKDRESEYTKFSMALEDTRNQIQTIIVHTKNKFGDDKSAIFDAQVDILSDPMLLDSVKQKITSENKNALLALNEATTEICQLFEMIEDEYLKERVADVRDVCQRLTQNLAGVSVLDLSNLSEKCIVIAKDLLPSDTATMDFENVLGFATEVGGRTSHTAIMARSLEIPAVVGVKNITNLVENGENIILDGSRGDLILNPAKEISDYYVGLQQEEKDQKILLAKIKELPAQTTDGLKVELSANIGSVKDVAKALENGAEGIGLFRTEFLYMDKDHFPTEEEQFSVYQEVAKQMKNRPVIIRTLDIGGDKELPYFKFPEELNPFLGWRAIRMCLDEIDIFKTQLRAILRASYYGKIRIMFPMIISVEEFLQAKVILEECKIELAEKSIRYDQEIEVGIMIETPAAVMLADFFASEVDFFSIGTNDLSQYTLAVDRGNEKISHLYTPYHPAVISSIKKVIDASHTAGKWTGICGEFAGDEKAALMLVGMGIDELSMSAASIPVVKNAIRQANQEMIKDIADKALLQKTTTDIVKIVETGYGRLKNL